jgi:hypothetical protein
MVARVDGRYVPVRPAGETLGGLCVHQCHLYTGALVPDLSPIQLLILVVLAVCLVGAYRLALKGRYILLALGLVAPPIWLAGFFWEARPGSPWDRRNR